MTFSFENFDPGTPVPLYTFDDVAVSNFMVRKADDILTQDKVNKAHIRGISNNGDVGSIITPLSNTQGMIKSKKLSSGSWLMASNQPTSNYLQQGTMHGSSHVLRNWLNVTRWQVIDISHNSPTCQSSFSITRIDSSTISVENDLPVNFQLGKLKLIFDGVDEGSLYGWIRVWMSQRDINPIRPISLKDSNSLRVSIPDFLQRRTLKTSVRASVFQPTEGASDRSFRIPQLLSGGCLKSPHHISDKQVLLLRGKATKNMRSQVMMGDEITSTFPTKVGHKIVGPSLTKNFADPIAGVMDEASPKVVRPRNWGIRMNLPTDNGQVSFQGRGRTKRTRAIKLTSHTDNTHCFVQADCHEPPQRLKFWPVTGGNPYRFLYPEKVTSWWLPSPPPPKKQTLTYWCVLRREIDGLLLLGWWHETNVMTGIIPEKNPCV